VKLCRSLRDGKIFDQAPQPVQRYVFEKKTADCFGWRFNNKPRSMPCGKKLRIILLNPGIVHWSDDGWKTTHDSSSRDSGVGVYAVDLPTQRLCVGREIVFTFFWPFEQRWEGINYSVTVE
jgi:glucoamylase